MTRRGVLRTLFAVRAMPMAPSAAAKDSWPARKAKQVVSSLSRRAPRLPWPRPTWRCSATEPGMVKASRPSPMAAAHSAASVRPRFTAMAVPRVYAQTALSKQMGCTPRTILSQSMPFARSISLQASRDSRPLAFRHASIFGMRRSIDSKVAMRCSSSLIPHAGRCT